MSNTSSSPLDPLLAGGLGLLGGIAGLTGSSDQQTMGSRGYQGGIPAYTASRSLKPNAFSQTDRRPGSLGRNYFTHDQSAQELYTPLGTDLAYPTPTAGTGTTAGTGITAGTGLTYTPGETTAGLDSTALAGILNMLGILGGEAGTTAGLTYTPPGETTTSETVDAGSTYTTGDGTTTTTSSVVANAINDYLQTLGYGLTDTDVTAANIQSALGENFTLAQLADAFGTTEDVLNEVLNPTSTTTTTTGADSTYTSTPGESTSTTTVVSNALNDFLVGRGFSTANKDVTQADIQAALAAGFTIDELVTAFDTTDAIINSILNPTSTTTTTTGGSSTWTPGTSTTDTNQQVVQNALNDFLVGRGFSTTDKNVTKADIQAALDEGFTIDELAIAFTPNPTDANAVAVTQARLQEILDWVDPNTTTGAAGGLVGLAGGGLASLGTQGYYLGGPTDGMADQVPATIDGVQPAALSDGEFVVPADVVSHLGNGNSDAGAQQLYSMMDRVRQTRTGTTKQGPEINPTGMMPA